MPDWQLTPEEEMFGDQLLDPTAMQQMVDENGMPIYTVPYDPSAPQQQPMVRPDGTGDPSQQQLDEAFPPPQRPPQAPPPQQPDPRLPPPADPSEPRPDPA